MKSIIIIGLLIVIPIFAQKTTSSLLPKTMKISGDTVSYIWKEVSEKETSYQAVSIIYFPSFYACNINFNLAKSGKNINEAWQCLDENNKYHQTHERDPYVEVDMRKWVPEIHPQLIKLARAKSPYLAKKWKGWYPFGK